MSRTRSPGGHCDPDAGGVHEMHLSCTQRDRRELGDGREDCVSRRKHVTCCREEVLRIGEDKGGFSRTDNKH